MIVFLIGQGKVWNASALNTCLCFRHVSTYCTLSSWRKDLITHLEGIQRYLLQFAEMAEEEGAPQPPPAESLCLASVTQPYPRSPKTLRKPDAAPLEYSQEQLSCWLEELEKESKWTEAHMASLKKRQANLSVRAKRIVLKVRSVMFNDVVRKLAEDSRILYGSVSSALFVIAVTM